LGLSPDHLTRSSPPPVRCRTEGALGVPIAFVSVTELQSRGSPHSHLLLVTDISPLTIQKYLDDPEFMEKFSRRIDSIVQCYLHEEAHENAKVHSALPTEEETPLHRDYRISTPCDNLGALKNFGEAVAASTNVHAHSATCHKGNMGQRQCRLAIPRACNNDPTSFLQIVRVREVGNTETSVRALERLDPRDHRHFHDPLMHRYDRRNIVMELYRPEFSTPSSGAVTADGFRHDPPPGPNGKVVAFSPVISACLRCNTDVEPLGNSAQEICAVFYLLKYMTKPAYELGNILSIARAARKHIIKYPSVAEDRGTFMRNAQHLLTRILNMQYGSYEISCQAAVLALRGFPSNVYSHDFHFCFIRPAIVFVRSRGDNSGEDEDEGLNDDVDDQEDLASSE